MSKHEKLGSSIVIGREKQMSLDDFVLEPTGWHLLDWNNQEIRGLHMAHAPIVRSSKDANLRIHLGTIVKLEPKALF